MNIYLKSSYWPKEMIYVSSAIYILYMAPFILIFVLVRKLLILKCLVIKHFLKPSSVLSKGHWRRPGVWPELLVEFWDISAQPASSHAPP